MMLERMRGRVKFAIGALLLGSCLVISACGADADLTIIRTPTPGGEPTPTATPQEG